MKPRQEFSPGEREVLIEQARQRREDGDKKCGPSAIKMAGNLSKAVVKHARDGFRKVTLPIYQRRLDKCNDCIPPDGFRVKNRCTHESCGCFIDKKAWWASEECPLSRWTETDFGV